MNALGYFFTAYTVIWVGLLLYVFRLVGKNRNLEKKLESLERKLNRK